MMVAATPHVEKQLPLILAAQAGSVRARNELIERNIGLIKSRVGYVVGFDNVAEYLGVGTLGFIQGIMTFDPARNCRLSSHASWRIYGAVTNAQRTAKDRISRGAVELNERWQLPRATARRDGPCGERLARCVDCLDERQRVVVMARAHGHLLRGIGEWLGISKERVRQLEAKAHRELRGMMTDGV